MERASLVAQLVKNLPAMHSDGVPGPLTGAEAPLPPTPHKGQARPEVGQRVHAEAVVKMGAGMILILGL